jgi:putative redox protein
MIDGEVGELAVHLAEGAGGLTGARPNGAGGSRSRSARRCLVLCHGLPVEPDAAARTGRTFPALADRLASESGWTVAACCLRGVGPSAGDFSLDGWLHDLRTVTAHVATAVGGPVWVAGFGVSGSLAVCLASAEPRVRGVATFGAPASFAPWLADPDAAVALARLVGVVRDSTDPIDAVAWAAAGRRLEPMVAAAALRGRPLLVVHGVDDEIVPVAHARELATAAGAGAELRVLAGAGHRLRADPRAIALLLGWLERQGP